MEFTDRLEALGLTKSQFADRLGVGKSAVSNWVSSGNIPAKAEELLKELEDGPKVDVGEPFPLGCLVDTNGYGLARVIRIDRCQTFYGNHKVYWCSRAQPGEKGWTWSGPAGQYPPKFLTRKPDVEWDTGHVRKASEG